MRPRPKLWVPRAFPNFKLFLSMGDQTKHYVIPSVRSDDLTHIGPTLAYNRYNNVHSSKKKKSRKKNICQISCQNFSLPKKFLYPCKNATKHLPSLGSKSNTLKRVKTLKRSKVWKHSSASNVLEKRRRWRLQDEINRHANISFNNKKNEESLVKKKIVITRVRPLQV